MRKLARAADARRLADRSEGLCRALFCRDELSADLPCAVTDPFVRGQLFETHWPAGSHFVRRNADLRAHAAFAAISEAGRCIPINGGRIDFREELLRSPGVAGHNAI